MSATLSAAASSLAELQTRLAVTATNAHGSYEQLAATHRELGRLRGSLARFMMDDADPSVSDNARGLAQNVVAAIDGLDRVVTEGMRAALQLVHAKREFADRVATWSTAASQ